MELVELAVDFADFNCRLGSLLAPDAGVEVDSLGGILARKDRPPSRVVHLRRDDE